MVRAVVRRSAITVPPALVPLFNQPPLVGEEKREDYEKLFLAIVATIKPSDTVVWLLARDFADLTWEIAREKRLKTQLIKLTEFDVVSKLVSPITPTFLPPDMSIGMGKKLAKQWAGDPKARQSVINKLADKGYDASDISTLAMNRAAPEIEVIDRRIGTYELRRIAAMKAIEQYSEASARRLAAASTDVIEGEFTEAVE